MSRAWLAAAPLALACAQPAPSVRSGGEIESALVGEVGAERALLWARASAAGPVRVECADEEGAAQAVTGEAAPERDLTVKLELGGLAPGTRYRCRSGAAWSGAFVTAPRAGELAPVRFAFGGDVGGQDACRDASAGYAIFDEIRERAPHFFVGLGDMIYADNPCTARGRFGNAQVPLDVGPAADLDAARAHWRYNRADAPFRRLMAETSYVAVWDDHETVNDVGPLDDTREQPPYAPGVHLLPVGLRAFLEHNPVREDGDAPGRLYRALRWGRHLELFVLDTRQYRDSDRAPDAAALPKTMLGREQRVWLERRLLASEATWKVVVSSVPISLPTGSARQQARDGWASHGTATGYERELAGIFETLAAAGARNLLFVTTDVHFAAGFRYRPVPAHGDFLVHEIVTGPLSAILGRTEAVDPTFAPERLFLHAAPRPLDVTTLDEARRWFNFGLVEIDADGRLSTEVVDGYGATVQRLELAPAAP